jgi:hypothetical protein
VTSWDEFEAAAPDLAARVGARLRDAGFVYAGTIRRDGTPRISPVEAHIAGGALVVTVVAGTHKARDLRRDPRITLNTPVAGPEAPGTEVKLRGRVVEVADAERQAVADGFEAASGWRPPASWHLFTIALTEAAAFDWDEGVVTLALWRDGDGVRHERRRVYTFPEA